MADSLPLSRSERAANRDRFKHDEQHSAVVSADSQSASATCLGAPPRDVGRMLERYGTMLPRYLDAQRLLEIQGSRQRWPLLRHTRAANESVDS